MENTKQFKVDIAGTDLVIETGLLAQQAAGAVTVSYGDTTVFTAVTNTDTPREGIDFFPLQCEYREKFYASGKFPGGFFKREARPSSKEILTARMCDRPIRPLFPDGYYNDVQVNSGRIGRSHMRAVSISFEEGRASRLKKPPGNLPDA